MAALAVRLNGDRDGLTASEAALRLSRDGPNEAAAERRVSSLALILGFVANPLVLILLLASGVSAAAGDILNAAIIVVIVVFSVALNGIQTYRSDRAVEMLRSTVAPLASVKRDGAWMEVPRRVVVVGDLVRLAPGDMVPADGVLLESDDLYIQQSALTGESLPVEKAAIRDEKAEGPEGPDSPAGVFLGTSVTSGAGVAVVTATGPRTLFGDVAKQLTRRAPETEFERGTRQFGVFITQTVFFLVLFVLLVNVVEKRNPLESILFAVALAVGLTPEFLPMIVSVTLAQGAVRMSRKQVIVKNLSALQNFGSIDILCSDKTGTLTTGEMELHSAIDPFGEPSEEVLSLGILNSLYGQGLQGIAGSAARSRTLSPLDAATLRQTPPEDGAGQPTPIDAIPFDFERRRQSVVVANESECTLISKGAPESILAVCSLVGDHPMDETLSERCRKAYEDLHSQGYRVLAVATRTIDRRPNYSISDERDLTLRGFLVYSDPPLADADEMLRELHRDGVRVKILTGDNEMVARCVCESVGLKDAEIVRGDEIDALTDPALAAVAERATVFARVSPGQKNRIIHALKARGHVVGYLGDGINDAPSLHAADVGISVASAVDVAREAADIILLERGLRVLHRGILEGRRAFGNVMKYLLMGTSSNFGNVISMAGAALFLPFLPMLPRQILLNNFLYDLAQVAIPTDRVDPVWIRKPRRWDIGLIRRFMFIIGPISSAYDFLTFWALMVWFRADAAFFHTGWFVESLATQTLVLFVIRTEGNPLRSRPSRLLMATVVAVVALGILIPFTPLGNVLGFVPLPPLYFVFLAGATATYLAIVQLVKSRMIVH